MLTILLIVLEKNGGINKYSFFFSFLEVIFQRFDWMIRSLNNK